MIALFYEYRTVYTRLSDAQPFYDFYEDNYALANYFQPLRVRIRHTPNPNPTTFSPSGCAYVTPQILIPNKLDQGRHITCVSTPFVMPIAMRKAGTCNEG